MTYTHDIATAVADAVRVSEQLPKASVGSIAKKTDRTLNSDVSPIVPASLSVRPVADRTVDMTYVRENDSSESILARVEQLQRAGIISIHKDSGTNAFVDSRGAQALTNGKQILLGSDHTNFENRKTQSILAHELAHVEQIHRAKKSGITITPDMVVDFEREADRRQQMIHPHGSDSSLFTAAKRSVSSIRPRAVAGPASTEASLVNRLAGSRAEQGGDRLVVSPQMEHPQTAVSTAPVASVGTPAAPVLAAPIEQGNIMNSGSEKFNELREVTETARNKAQPLDIDQLSDQIFERIKDRLTVERERFHK